MNKPRKMLLLLNHNLLSEQRDDAIKNFNIADFQIMPDSLKKLWSNVPPENKAISDYLDPLKKWIENCASLNDCILIQGDFGATFLMVNFAIKKRLVPLHATTIRNAIESVQDDGSIKMEHIFKFCRFRQYGM